MLVQMVSLASITPYDNNPRHNDAAVEAVARSIQAYGWRVPVVCDENFVIIAGHTRFKAAQKLRLSEVPVHVALGLSPEQAKAYRIADNQTATLSTWDDERLTNELLALQTAGFNVELTGLSADELMGLLQPDATGLTDPDDIPEPPDAADNRTGVLDSQGGVLTSAYDAAHRLTSRALTGGGQAARAELAHSDRDQRTELRRYSDAAGTTLVSSSSYAYDDAGRHTSLIHKSGAGTPLVTYSWAYDAADRLATETRNGTTKTYSYDTTSQLTNDSAVTYSYDLNGNRTMAGHTTGAANRLSTDGTWTYTYDAEGDLTKRSKGASAETWTFGYDHRNQLAWAEQRATDGGTLLLRVDYTYDVYGNLLSRADGTTTKRYAYEITDATPGITDSVHALWAEVDGAGSVTTRYLMGEGQGERWARLTATSVHWVAQDRLGSVREVLDSTGAVVAALSYDGFGNVTSETAPSLSGEFGFTGLLRDAGTGLLLAHWRVFGPGWGGWMQEDPWVFGPGDANLRRYVGNRPVNATDLSGLEERKLRTLTPEEMRAMMRPKPKPGTGTGGAGAGGTGGTGGTGGAGGPGGGGTGAGMGGPGDKHNGGTLERYQAEMRAAGKLAIGLGEVASLMPVVGDTRDLYELVNGKDLLTGENLTRTERVITAAGVLLPIVPASWLRRAWNASSGWVSSLFRRGKNAPNVLPALRQAYIGEVEALKSIAVQMRSAGKTPEDIARALHQMRRDIGIRYKDLTPVEKLAEIHKRNMEKYGDKLGPSIEYLRGKGKTWDEIIESASRSGGADLGLAKPR